MGNLTRDPELRYTSSGKAVCSFSLASNEYFQKDGEKKEETTFMKVVVWGKRGENCAQYLKKGSPAYVEGKLRNRSWESEDGQKKSATEIIALDVQFLGRRSSGDGSPPLTDEDNPF